MGREIIFEVHDNKQCVWPDPNNIEDALYVCGRDDATSYVASLCQNNEETLYLSCNDYQTYLKIKENLQEYYDKDMFEIQKANITMEDLREARRNCNVYDEFVKFSQAMDDTQDWIDNNNWSRAKNMLDCLNKCYDKMLDLVNSDPSEDRQAVIERYKVAIIWSE